MADRMTDNKELIEKLLEFFPDKMASCSDARKVAEELGVEIREIGKLCDLADIKIFGCELGCF